MDMATRSSRFQPAWVVIGACSGKELRRCLRDRAGFAQYYLPEMQQLPSKSSTSHEEKHFVANSARSSELLVFLHSLIH
ncbi:hypothetical protein GALMADRAFT_236709 [Galerina marginata CBS 339.88]|uniref:Uncharacterized protein n=1 Tax=Galerina marginata (strain CBS 339.88) TaxID=685588 RepID=A0A067TVV9_GALM3|nr:hypothetical protein GALMADRAFT_236709 [Galerina marginata CBS 339.88]